MNSPHKVWKGTLSFGLVSIPVEVNTATKDHKSSLKQYRLSDLSPIRYKKVAEADEKEVPAAQIVKGLPTDDGLGNKSVVVLDPVALDNLNIESTKVIAIDCFVNPDEIDQRFYQKPYFLQPDKSAKQGYGLLFTALKETNKVGIAKVALRNREYLVAVRADTKFNVLTLETLRWEDELLDASSLTPANTDCPQAQLDLAIQLVNTTTQKFNPSKYEDSYAKGLNDLIEQSRNPKSTKKVTKKSAKKVSSAPDMVSILQASLDQSKSKK